MNDKMWQQEIQKVWAEHYKWISEIKSTYEKRQGLKNALMYALLIMALTLKTVATIFCFL